MIIVDLTMQAAMDPVSLESPPDTEPAISEDDTNLRDEERAYTHASTRPSSHSPYSQPNRDDIIDETELRTRAGSVNSSTLYIRKKTAQLLEAFKPSSHRADRPISPKLAALVEAFRTSENAAALEAEREEVATAPAATNGDELPDVAVESSLTRGRKRASWLTQFRILSGRAFKNLYRDPALLTAHYVSSIAIARECFVPCFFPRRC